MPGKIDPALMSVMIMALVTSGLVVLTLAREPIAEKIVLLKNEFPEILVPQASLTSSDRMDFSFAVLSRHEFSRLEIRYSILAQSEGPSRNLSSGESLSDLARDTVPISALVNETENQFVPSDVLDVLAEYRGRSLPGLFYDFPLVRIYSDESLSGDVQTSFLLLQNGTQVLYLEGPSDFFFYRLGGFKEVKLPGGGEIRSSIARLRIWRNEQAETYSSEARVPTGWRDISESPGFGTVLFEDVAKNERFTVDFTVETPERPPGMIAQVIRVYGDGELYLTQVNLIK